jgi:hypothetical protein
MAMNVVSSLMIFANFAGVFRLFANLKNYRSGIAANHRCKAYAKRLSAFV